MKNDIKFSIKVLANLFKLTLMRPSWFYYMESPFISQYYPSCKVKDQLIKGRNT